MPTYDEISNLDDEDQQQFHAEAQRHLRRQWAEAEAKTEREYDDQKRNRTQNQKV